jgi:hypothetical protein
MTPEDGLSLWRTRRHFFRDCGVGIGRIALGSLLARTLPAASPMQPKRPHFEPKARNVIYLFMAGGPSQLDMFVHKPVLSRLSGQAPPESLVKGKRFAFMERMAHQKMLGSPWKFSQHGASGAWISELLPHTAGIADEVAIINTMRTANFNHAPAKIFAHTGSVIAGRPSIGAWITYGLGSESENLPGFVALQSGPRGPRNGPVIWGSGFLPSAYQGVPFLPGAEPVFNLASQPGITPRRQERALKAIRALNELRYAATADDEIATRIASYETAYRMQTSGPELMNLAGETKETLDLYGAEPGKNSFANNCLLARRLVERGVRCVQVYHTDWDHHTGIQNNLPQRCREIDRASAALIQDLNRRGLLERTLVICGGEFGRTPISDGEIGAAIGRNHHIEAYSTWLAGGGVKGGQVIGETDDIGFSPVADPVEVHDLHATILHLLGLDHTRLTYRFQGRDFRLTDISGHVVKKLLD